VPESNFLADFFLSIYKAELILRVFLCAVFVILMIYKTVSFAFIENVDKKRLQSQVQLVSFLHLLDSAVLRTLVVANLSFSVLIC
jgi:Ca2+/Na+ antiporter